MPVYTNQTYRRVEIPLTPRRIISVVPSQTELLYDLGLENEIIGITRFCIHPDHWFRSKNRVGGTKDLRIERIVALQPDLIIANKEENVKEQIERLSTDYPVWISDVHDLTSAQEMIAQLGEITDRITKANEICEKILYAFEQINLPVKPVRTAYLIWQHPLMTVGHDSFIHAMMQKAGLQNIFGEQKRYPEITLQQLQDARPELVLLSSEPFPFTQKHIDELQPHLPGTTLLLADGEMFSWYGSRMIQAPAYFNELLKAVR